MLPALALFHLTRRFHICFDKNLLKITMTFIFFFCSTKGEKVTTIKYTGIIQARKQFFYMIRRINAYGSIMGPLPPNICTIFKLTYYDESNIF